MTFHDNASAHPDVSGMTTLPPDRPGPPGDDELAAARVVTLFRGSYASAQGRQWLQVQIIWWTLQYLRRNDIKPDWDTLDSPTLVRKVIGLPLPPGHATVHPSGQTALNLALWWRLLRELARTVYCDEPLPDVARVEHIAWRLGLRPWMSSATYEEMAGISRALESIDEHHQSQASLDDFLVRVLLPSLFLVELHWVHAPNGRPGAKQTRLVLPERHEHAVAKWTKGTRLTVLDRMYMRAGDVAAHVTASPQSAKYPHLRRIRELATELEAARRPGTPVTAAGALTGPELPRSTQEEGNEPCLSRPSARFRDCSAPWGPLSCSPGAPAATV